MRISRILNLAFLATALNLSIEPALAASSGEVFIREGTVIEGKQFDDGNYTIKWSGNADRVTVKVSRGSKVFATTSGKIEQRPEKSPSDAVTYEKNGDSQWRIKEIRFGGKKDVLVLQS